MQHLIRKLEKERDKISAQIDRFVLERVQIQRAINALVGGRAEQMQGLLGVAKRIAKADVPKPSRWSAATRRKQSRRLKALWRERKRAAAAQAKIRAAA